MQLKTTNSINTIMKRIFIFILLFASIKLVEAQSEVAKWDSTYRPGTYQVKKELFEYYQHKKSDIVFLGNSITDYNEWNELLQLPNARNRGISGDITFGVLERLQEIIDGQPSKIFILIGINDISRNIPDEVIIDNYKKIISRIKKGTPRTDVFVQSILPVNNTFNKYPNHYNKDEHILAVNQAIKRLAEVEGVTFINIHDSFLDSEGRLDSKYTYEGLHLNAEGYKLWARILNEGNYLKNRK